MTAVVAELNHFFPTNRFLPSYACQRDDGSPLSKAALKPHYGKIHDMRRQNSDYPLNIGSLARVRHDTRATECSDEARICDTYYREATDAACFNSHTAFVAPEIPGITLAR